jgi:aminoglycoside phosphotransferase (APT) family kinase protein
MPDEAAYVAAYCRRTGRADIPHWNFYLAFSMFRLASILQGVYARGLQGNAASAYALQRGAAARQIAERAWAVSAGDHS